ncbi:hypothetical protein JTB14_002092 [Gonioctena quinquepunctata]|nr:hypothetical protein JTB14_002092 [Gonioctena quinquepunctata]
MLAQNRGGDHFCNTFTNLLRSRPQSLNFRPKSSSHMRNRSRSPQSPLRNHEIIAKITKSSPKSSAKFPKRLRNPKSFTKSLCILIVKRLRTAKISVTVKTNSTSGVVDRVVSSESAKGRESVLLCKLLFIPPFEQSRE